MTIALKAAGVTPCGVCGASCIPMADYDAPTCASCDAAWEQILATVATLAVGIAADPIGRPVTSCYGPAPAAVIAELVDAICPPLPRADGRVVAHLEIRRSA